MSQYKHLSSSFVDETSIKHELRNAAQNYHESGWVVVPLTYGSKSDGLPMGHNQMSLEDFNLESWSEAPKNIMLKLGDISDGVLDVDLDCPEAQRFSELFIDLDLLPLTARFGWGPITHLIYRVPNAQIRRLTYKNPIESGDGEMLLELRGNGHGTVIAPSKHQVSGKNLSWVDGDWVPTEIKLSDLERALGLLATVSVFSKLWPRESGSRNDSAMAMAGCLVRSGLVNEFQVRSLLEQIALFANDEEAKSRGLVAVETFKKHERGERISSLGKLEDLFGVEVKKWVIEWLALEGGLKEVKSLRPFVLSPRELLAKNITQDQYLIKNVIKQPGLSQIFGVRGCGKTWTVYLLAKAVCNGENFLCYQSLKQGNVLIIDGEMSLSDIQKRLKEMGLSDNPRLKILSSKILFEQDIHINIYDRENQAWLNKLFDELQEEGWFPDLIILDNLSSVSGGVDENNNSDQELFIKWMIDTRFRKSSFLFVHHAGKDRKSRGATRREDPLDTCIQIKQGSRTVGHGPCFEVSFTKTRGPEPEPPLVSVELMLDEEGIWAPAIATQAKVIPGYVLTLKCIYDYGPITQKDITSKRGVSASQISKDIKKLKSINALPEVKQGHKISFYLGGKDLLKQYYPELTDELEGVFPDVM